MMKKGKEKREGKKGREQTDPRGLFLGIRFPFSQMLQEHYFIAFIFLILFFCIHFLHYFLALIIVIVSLRLKMESNSYRSLI